MIALIILSTTFVSLRLLSRHIAHAGYWWDDVLIILALLISLAPPALNIYAVKHTGFGKHIYRLSDDDETRQADVTETLRILWTFQLSFVLATGTIKLCILTFYHRISPASTSRCWRNVLFAMAAVVVSFTLGVLLLTIFQCTPIHKFWDTEQPRHCIFNPLTNLLITGSLNTVLDFIVVLLPIPLLWQLRTTIQQRTVLTAIFLSAGSVCVVSIVRLVVFSKVDMEDVTWDSSAVTLWSAVEPCAGIVGACVPSLRPLCSVGLRRVRRMRSPTLVAGSSKGGRLDSGAAMMPWVLQDVESGNTPDEDNRNGMGGKEICVFNTLCTVPSAMRRAQEKPSAVDGETQIKVEEVEIPWGGIKVKTEIRWSVQERYDYDDRLY
ncbi:MAG: hypothetical protein OHK93_005758 [Ramalina farinacea]|uniref:Rhodopsin domain-containing protein n=1 Tax=Ramalina farinacea TaxID=258253 RepID=A0AA43TW71_9LECA|nr:hypothetical protein [Ramalina farinacea]